MIFTQVPDYSWQKVSCDLFSFDGELYVLVGDYFSNFVEYTKVSASVIIFLQEQFERYGIPKQLISDGGPRYDLIIEPHGWGVPEVIPNDRSPLAGLPE